MEDNKCLPVASIHSVHTYKYKHADHTHIHMQKLSRIILVCVFFFFLLYRDCLLNKFFYTDIF